MRNATTAAAAGLLVLLALAGCGGPAGPEVLTGNPDRVSFTWDSEAGNIGDVTEQARRHCSRYGKQASLLSNSAASKSGTFFTTVYDCVLP